MSRFIIIAFSVLIVSGCQKSPILPEEKKFPVTLKFMAMIGEEILELNQDYLNPHNEQYSVSTYKYYIHKIQFTNSRELKTRDYSFPNEHFLIDHDMPASTSIERQLSEGEYDQISFYIGVDSSRNFSGAQTDALDPLLGMFWTWSTGYIMAKLEGNSPSAQTINNAFEYHIGGFSAPNNVVRKVTIPLQKTFDPQIKSELIITSNIQTWFEGTHVIRISESPIVIMPGINAVKVADNYSEMFNVKSLPE